MVFGFTKEVLTQEALINWSLLWSLDVVVTIVFSCILSWLVLNAVYGMAMENRLWRLGYYMVVPIALALMLCI